MKRMITALALGAAVLGLATCGGDDNGKELTLNDYFSTIQEIEKEADERAKSIASDSGGTSENDTADGESMSGGSFWEAYRDIVRETVA